LDMRRQLHCVTLQKQKQKQQKPGGALSSYESGGQGAGGICRTTFSKTGLSLNDF
jgi:hypothetical protein